MLEEPNVPLNPMSRLPETQQLNKYGYSPDEWARLDGKEKDRAYRRASYAKAAAADPERCRRKKRLYYAKNRERIRARENEKRRNNVEKYKAGERMRYYRNHESRLASWKAWYYRNQQQALQRAKSNQEKKTSLAQMKRSPEAIWQRINAAVPASLARQVRDELIGNMCLAVLEGELLVKNIKAEVAKFMANYNREYDGFKTLSLDETRPGTKDAYVDRLTKEDMPW